MNIIIKATHYELTEKTRALLEEKFASIERLVANAAVPATLSCEIEQSIAVERAGAKYRAEGNLLVDSKTLRAESEGLTLEEAVDTVRDDLVRQLKSVRGKRRELVRRGGAALKRMLRFSN